MPLVGAITRRKLFIYSRERGTAELVVPHGKGLYLTRCDVNTWLARYHGFSSETGRYFLISMAQRQTRE